MYKSVIILFQNLTANFSGNRGKTRAGSEKVGTILNFNFFFTKIYLSRELFQINEVWKALRDRRGLVVIMSLMDPIYLLPFSRKMEITDCLRPFFDFLPMEDLQFFLKF